MPRNADLWDCVGAITPLLAPDAPPPPLSANRSTILRAVTDGSRCQSSASERHVPIADSVSANSRHCGTRRHVQNAQFWTYAVGASCPHRGETGAAPGELIAPVLTGTFVDAWAADRYPQSRPSSCRYPHALQARRDDKGCFRSSDTSAWQKYLGNLPGCRLTTGLGSRVRDLPG
jgi:hypothetical protein